MTTPEDQTKEFELSGRIESFLVSAAAFIHRFSITLFHLAFQPSLFIRNTHNKTSEAIYVKPVTFLTLMTYLNVKAFRIAVVFLWVMLARIEGCRGESNMAEEPFSLMDHLTLPSFEEVVLIGLPMLIGVLALSWVARKLLLRNGDDYERKMLSCVCYSVGFLYLLLILGLILVGDFRFEKGIQLNGIRLSGEVSEALIAGLIIWPMFGLHVMLKSLIPPEECRVSRPRLRGFYVSLISALTILGATSISAAIIYPLAVLEAQKLNLDDPLLAIGLVSCDSAPTAGSTLHAVAKNNSKREFYLVPNSNVFYRRETSFSGMFFWKSDVAIPSVVRDPASIPITFKPNVPTPLLFQFSRPIFETSVPHYTHTRNLLHLKVVDANGNSKTIRSRILENGEDADCLNKNLARPKNDGLP